jgi:DNA mismatch endonuclease (patch repair protein)
MGARYRLHVKDVTGKPDIVIAKFKFAVFVDGDFWHGNEHKIRGFAALEDLFPSNAEFWCKKIRQNMDRDQKTTEQLTSQGWTVTRIWASDILADPLHTAKLVLDKINVLKAGQSLLAPDLEPT